MVLLEKRPTVQKKTLVGWENKLYYEECARGQGGLPVQIVVVHCANNIITE